MKKSTIPKGSLKVIRFKEVPAEVKSHKKPRGRRRLVEKEQKTRGIQIQYEQEEIYADVIDVDGSCKIISSSEDPRIETYAALTFRTNDEPFGVFIVSYGKKHLQVIAPSEHIARAMHPTEGYEWDVRKKQWRCDGGELQGKDHYWGAVDALHVLLIGTDEYAEVPERTHFWED